MRAVAKQRIECLCWQRKLELSREEARIYRMEHAHVKEIVGLETKMASMKKSTE